MRSVRWSLLCLGLVAGSALSGAAAEAPAPDATQVVVRSKSTFAQALEAALQPLLAEQPTRPVLFVLDVTPNVRRHGDVLTEALAALDGPHAEVTSWRLAALGGKPTKAAATAGDIARAVADHLQEDTPATSTIGALAASIKRSKARGTAIVYINDWRFEDDADLEGFIKNLKRRGNALSVIGTEAAFDRAWNDGWVSPDDRFNLNDPSGFQVRDYHEGIGRSPFAKGDDEAPWHGGDSAFPAAPYRWNIFLWQEEFTEYDFNAAASGGASAIIEDLLGKDGKPPDFEELERRLKKKGGDTESPPPGEDANRYFPIPAAYGPYGLMRAAGEAGGRYVLWSWNPGGRRKVHYEYSRCNLFPPDLRPRKQILKTLRKDLLAGAMVKAWCMLETAHDNAIEHNAPLKSDLHTPRSIDRFASGGGDQMIWSWESKGDWRIFQRAAEKTRVALAKAGKLLDMALAKTPDAPREATLRRMRANAELFRHVMRVVQLEIDEGLVASRDLPKNAWSNPGHIPGVGGRVWIRAGHDPEKVRTAGEEPTNKRLAQVVLAERKRLLARYRGTPVAEIIGLNEVEPLRFTWWQRGGEMPDIGRSPTESDGSPKPHLPGAPSTGGGPTTGK